MQRLYTYISPEDGHDSEEYVGLARQLGPGPSCLPEARDDGWGCHSQT